MRITKAFLKDQELAPGTYMVTIKERSIQATRMDPDTLKRVIYAIGEKDLIETPTYKLQEARKTDKTAFLTPDRNFIVMEGGA